MPTVPRSFKGGAGGRFGVKVTGVQKVVSKFKALVVEKQTQMFIGIKRAVIMVEAEAKRLIKNGYYQPAIDEGNLIKAVTSVVQLSSFEVEGIVGVRGIHYAVYVHEGTYKMPERPFLVDALDNKKAEILRELMGLISRSVV